MIRSKPRAQWIPIQPDGLDLEEAFNTALELDSPEVSIWLVTPFGDISYWRNTEGDLFNSTVLTTQKY